MKVKELISQLEEVDPEMDASAWIKTALVWTTPALTFEEAGKAMRIMLKLVGKPTMNYNKDASGHSLHHRSVIWKMGLEKHIMCATALAEAGITSVKSDGSWYFSFRIPYSTFVTAFYTSDDPEVWKVEQEKAVVRAKQKVEKRDITRLMKQAEANARWNEKQKEWEEEQKERREKEKKEKEEKERLLILGSEALKLQEKASEIKVENLNFERDVEVEGD